MHLYTQHSEGRGRGPVVQGPTLAPEKVEVNYMSPCFKNTSFFSAATSGKKKKKTFRFTAGVGV